MLRFHMPKWRIFDFHRYFLHVNEPIIQRLTWGYGTLKPRTLLLWDLENIPFGYFHQIRQKLRFAPERAFMITKQNLSAKSIQKMERNGFEIFSQHSSDSDTKIKNIYKILSGYEEFIFVTSDTDFVGIAKKVLAQKKPLTWVMRDRQKKGIVMKMNIANPLFKIITVHRDKELGG